MPDLPGVVFLLVLLAIFVVTVRVCGKDARRRGKSPYLVTFLAIVFFPVGLICWIFFRPEPLDDDGAREPFRLDDHRVQ